MPNWVENEVSITGDNKILREIVEKYCTEFEYDKPEVFDLFETGEIKPDKQTTKITCLDFNKIIPMPEGLKEITAPNRVNPEEVTKKYGYPDWYEWRLANWGVKWNVNPYLDGQSNDGELIFSFDTAWSTPDGVLSELSKKYPDITIVNNCNEEAGFFAGKIIYKNGEVTDETAPVDNTEE
jgi:hypothetical protein